MRKRILSLFLGLFLGSGLMAQSPFFKEKQPGLLLFQKDSLSKDLWILVLSTHYSEDNYPRPLRIKGEEKNEWAMLLVSKPNISLRNLKGSLNDKIRQVKAQNQTGGSFWASYSPVQGFKAELAPEWIYESGLSQILQNTTQMLLIWQLRGLEPLEQIQLNYQAGLSRAESARQLLDWAKNFEAQADFRAAALYHYSTEKEEIQAYRVDYADQALESLQESLDLRWRKGRDKLPAYADQYRQEVFTLIQKGERAQAWARLKKAYEQNKGINLAEFHILSSEPSYSEMLAPEQFEAVEWYEAIRVYLALGRADEAIYWLKPRLSKGAESAYYYYLLGRAYELKSSARLARKSYRKALKLNPDLRPAQLALEK